MSTIERVREYVQSRRTGEMFATRELLEFGERNPLDQALFKLVAEGTIRRLASGVFVRNDEGMIEPTIGEISRFKIQVFNRLVVETDRKTANEFGLCESPGPKHVYYTDGASSSFKVLGLVVKLVQRASRKLMLTTSPVRKAIKALWSLKQEKLTIDLFHSTMNKLGKDLLPEFHSQVRWMPWWLGDLSHRLRE